MKEITNEINTSCKDCVFSTWEDDSQIGCELGKIALYREKGTTIIEAFDDEDREFFVVKAWCSTYRDDLWKIAYSDKNLHEQLDQETYPKVSYAIIMDNLDKEGFQKTLDSIKKQAYPAKRVIVTCTSPKDYISVLKHVKEELEELYGTNFRVHCTGKDMSFEAVLDDSFKIAVNGFYMGLKCGDEVPEDAIELLHYALNKKLKSIALVKNGDNLSGSLHQAVLYKYLYGYRGASFETKLVEGEEFDKTLESNSLITDWDKLRCLYQESQS
tara:strand:- start:98 stop:910 length:813 start_codon:yes stop_codon:yes gene_type:complete